jgi:hypothetical protein
LTVLETADPGYLDGPLVPKGDTLKRMIILVGVLSALAMATTAQASTPPPLTTGEVNPGFLTIAPPVGWVVDRDASGVPQCSGNDTTSGRAWDSTSWTGSGLVFVMDGGPGSHGDASCDVTKHQSVIRHYTGRRTKLGIHTTSRSSGAYLSGGNCAGTGPDSSGGLITTCLFAHASLTYTLVKPRHRKFVSITRRVTRGIEPCRNSSWHITHKRGSRKWHATFTHGSKGGFSPCDIEHVSINYRWSARVDTSLHGISQGTY